jgi:hypothetical protein
LLSIAFNAQIQHSATQYHYDSEARSEESAVGFFAFHLVLALHWLPRRANQKFIISSWKFPVIAAVLP